MDVDIVADIIAEALTIPTRTLFENTHRESLRARVRQLADSQPLYPQL